MKDVPRNSFGLFDSPVRCREKERVSLTPRHIERQLDAGAFCDFYAAKGWKVGQSPMRDWRAAARNWARRDRDGPSGRRRGSSEGVSGRAHDWIGDYA